MFLGPQRERCFEDEAKKIFAELDKAILADDTVEDEEFALYLACEYGHLKYVEYLVGKGVSIDEMNETEEKTPLMVACELGYADIAKFLVEHGADVNLTTDEDETALIVASQYGHLEIVKMLLENGADIETKDGLGYTAFSSALSNEMDDVVAFLVDKGVDLNQLNPEGVTLLTEVIHGERTNIAKLLIDAGADLDAENEDGSTALNEAIMMENEEIIRCMVEKGVNLFSSCAISGVCLGQIIKEFSPELSKFCIEKCVIPQDEEVAREAMICAIKKNDFELIKALADKNFNLNEEIPPEDDDSSPIVYSQVMVEAAIIGNNKVIEYLLEKGAFKDPDALTEALKAQKYESAKLLVSKKFNINHCNSDSKTPLMITISNKNIEFAKYLLENGADTKGALNVSLREGPEMVKFMIEKGANVMEEDRFGSTVLDNAIFIDNLEIVKLVVEAGADVNAVDVWGSTPLAKAKSEEVREYLRSKGAK